MADAPPGPAHYLRPARADFIVSGWPVAHFIGNAKMRADGNPDLAELLAYNVMGCKHENVRGVLTPEEAPSYYGSGLEVWEARCPDCRRLVLAVPGAPW